MNKIMSLADHEPPNLQLSKNLPGPPDVLSVSKITEEARDGRLRVFCDSGSTTAERCVLQTKVVYFPSHVFLCLSRSAALPSEQKHVGRYPWPSGHTERQRR